ncbi:transporter substrate-binding domain-containing protein [Cypionkella sp.]|uniref:transporter substrate-binding domain-containing protein n=1 Tax=Cypionkella sp. TaxID=2811411 RepID=UPI002724298F|nr:transporter substrate-binding domain-containing protein [Cypionkella sp.]MDO8984439.1 transporter substrate-binding domain-containing protein [Cypionkella sp.]MDP2048082.1 transporter substrate-binding domain-containing protein [Cypionkella sp.]
MLTLKSLHQTRLGFAFAAGLAAAMTSGSAYAQSTDGAVRTIHIATAAESRPLSWGALGVEPQGYEPDVLKAINAKLPQYKFEMEGAADIAQETGLVTGKYDMVTGGYYKSDARAEQFYIPTTPLGVSTMRIYSLKGSGINEMKDLVGKRIVPVTAGGGVFRFVTKWQEENPDFVLDVATSSAGIPFPNRMQEVNNGKSDALILPSNLGQKEVIENQKLDLVASEPVASNNTYILIGKSEENAVLLADVDRVLAELKADGTLDQISQKWFGEDVARYMK